ncbi:MAG: hypothetical protein KDA89_05200, partial [Planctomycetaceae bacterium]|nr:hypothetical protein [Planctomycetaceae bacterium]
MSIANVNPFQTVVSDGLAYFFADGGDGRELWTSDGTSVGTTQVVDLNPGTADGINSILGTGVGKVLLKGQNESSGLELILTDGTAGGTTIVDPTLGTPPSNIHDVLKVGDRFYISAGSDLVVTDGTYAGTTVLKTFSSTFNAPRELTWFKDQLFFTAEGSSAEGRELWRSDGTVFGTVLHKDIRAGSNDGNPERLTVAGQNLFFVADDGVHGEELWEVDLGDAGARLHTDFLAGSSDGDIALLQAQGDSLFVIANDTLFVVSSGTAASGAATVLAATKSNTIMPWGDAIYFGGYDAQHGNELWRTDGTVTGTYLVADLLEGPSSSNPGGGVVIEGSNADGGSATTNAKLVFRAAVGANNHQLWSTDGTTGGTKQLTSFEPTVDFGLTASFTPVGMTVLNNHVYFEAFDAEHGRELWRSDGTAAGTELVADLRPGAFPNPLTLTQQGESWWDKRIDAPTVFNGQLFFRTFDPATGHELWVSDGTQQGSRLAVDAIPGTHGSYPSQLFTSDDRLYLTADTLSYGTGTLPGSGELFYVNESPLVWSAQYATLRNQPITVPLNAIDRDGDDLVYEVVTGPSAGSVQIVDDSVVFTPASDDVSEQVISVRAFDGSLYSTPATYRFTVKESAAAVFFAESETTLTEQEGLHLVEVRLSAPVSTIVNVPYRVEGGSVLAASIANTGSVTFGPGETIATIPVLLADDSIHQSAGSTIEVTLTGSADAVPGDYTQHIISVTDNDSIPVLSLPEPFQKVDEADTTLGIVVSLSHP